MSRDEGRQAVEPITVRIPDAVRLTGLSRSRVYELMRAGEIGFVKIGGSTLIPIRASRPLSNVTASRTSLRTVAFDGEAKPITISE